MNLIKNLTLGGKKLIARRSLVSEFASNASTALQMVANSAVSECLCSTPLLAIISPVVRVDTPVSLNELSGVVVPISHETDVTIVPSNCRIL